MKIPRAGCLGSQKRPFAPVDIHEPRLSRPTEKLPGLGTHFQLTGSCGGFGSPTVDIAGAPPRGLYKNAFTMTYGIGEPFLPTAKSATDLFRNRKRFKKFSTKLGFVHASAWNCVGPGANGDAWAQRPKRAGRLPDAGFDIGVNTAFNRHCQADSRNRACEEIECRVRSKSAAVSPTKAGIPFSCGTSGWMEPRTRGDDGLALNSACYAFFADFFTRAQSRASLKPWRRIASAAGNDGDTALNKKKSHGAAAFRCARATASAP